MALQPHTSNLPPTLEWRDETLYLLDQTRLPLECVIEATDSVEAVWRAIHELRVRGAPAIGVAAAYGLCVAMQPERQAPRDAFLARLEQHAAHLDSARPTAVNLRWALERMLAHARGIGARTGAEIYEALVAEATRIHREDVELCARIGEHGRALIKAGSGVLTHCNAGALATTGIGTATAPLYCAHRDGVPFRVYADETRPLLQGARLTAYELQQAGLDVTLITDSMAPTLMAQGLIDLVIVGTDRVAANGDVANKIGTLGVAIAAKHFCIPFYVACPSSTLDLRTARGADIVIEERGADEVAQFAGRRTAPEGIKVRNPAFDVTPHALVTGIVTELGIVRAPFEDNLAALFAAGAAV
ncbi:S-methyl-5-thioribose-1-phosphate isomerase [Paraburkholderia oxyphila]|uniref:S-methyl-5-thioribose-1-phosphate isomerase n=1 Tax=Paraburkholderia oxyphila TaxID=614212 RepID=UPI00048476C1|nr:S-methyl-5-thioribose-1-phosphate isomerase [Paraburkholderia oxyphila]